MTNTIARNELGHTQDRNRMTGHVKRVNHSMALSVVVIQPMGGSQCVIYITYAHDATYSRLVSFLACLSSRVLPRGQTDAGKPMSGERRL